MKISKSELQNFLFEIWKLLEGQIKEKLLESFDLTSEEDVKKILQINGFPLVSDLDIFHKRMIEGKFDKSFVNELAIDKKIARIEYQNLIEKNKHRVFQIKNAQNQMKLDCNQIADVGENGEALSCSTYDSNFEENEGFGGHKSRVADIISRHKQSLRNAPSQKTQPVVTRPARVNFDKQMIKKTKATKNLLTIQRNSPESIQEFRNQEQTRYLSPKRPFTYKLPNGAQRVVAPVSKKASDHLVKPRDHYLLRSKRPAYITLLCLVRDSAARLPKGFGTRADICELLRESQFINQANSDGDKMSSVVSGALDRLHYEKDPCVKYDSEKKLWFYLH